MESNARTRWKLAAPNPPRPGSTAPSGAPLSSGRGRLTIADAIKKIPAHRAVRRLTRFRLCRMRPVAYVVTRGISAGPDDLLVRGAFELTEDIRPSAGEASANASPGMYSPWTPTSARSPGSPAATPPSSARLDPMFYKAETTAAGISPAAKNDGANHLSPHDSAAPPPPTPLATGAVHSAENY
ncbi:hypothetical protein GCM10010284_68150 [Streptomyces rubiginosohelvolus]|nr:hypothetical protein GCM10010284_68150 [Streptomyces rubiginosohelvolus]